MEEKNIKFALAGIRELGFLYTNPSQNNLNIIPEITAFDGKFDINYRWNLEKNTFGVVMDISYLINQPDNIITENLKLTVLYEFFVENLNDVFIVRTNQDFDIDKNLEITFVSIAISTTRGILFEKTRGTYFSNFLFPLINPADHILSKKIKENAETNKKGS
jgi:hypothetical protein